MFVCSVGSSVWVCVLCYDRSCSPPKPLSGWKMMTHIQQLMCGIMLSCVQVVSLEGMRSSPQCCCRDTVSHRPCQRSHLHSSASFLMPFQALPHACLDSPYRLRFQAAIIDLNEWKSNWVHACLGYLCAVCRRVCVCLWSRQPPLYAAWLVSSYSDWWSQRPSLCKLWQHMGLALS